jgi:hypothetical protein
MPTVLDPKVNYNLKEAFRFYCLNPSGISDELPMLLKYGCLVDEIIEFGVREGRSTTAWLMSRPKTLISYEKVHNGVFLEGRYKRWAKRQDTNFQYVIANVLAVEIPETDLLFIDTLHTYGQLSRELELHANKARQYILLHDTVAYGKKSEKKKGRGLRPAINEFLAREGAWYIKEEYKTKSGLTVLARK